MVQKSEVLRFQFPEKKQKQSLKHNKESALSLGKTLRLQRPIANSELPEIQLLSIE